MIGNIVARRYARAIFAIGKKKGVGDLETYGKDLAALAEMIKAAPEVHRIFKNPIFHVEEKKKIVEKMLAKASACGMICNFCNLLADKNRLAYLPEIEAEFGALLDIEKGVVRGELVTAIELAKAKQDELKAKLEAQAGKQLVLDFSADESILGGVVLKVGDKVLDASLRAQLNILKENIKRGE